MLPAGRTAICTVSSSPDPTVTRYLADSGAGAGAATAAAAAVLRPAGTAAVRRSRIPAAAAGTVTVASDRSITVPFQIAQPQQQYGTGYGQRYLAPADIQAQLAGKPAFYDNIRGEFVVYRSPTIPRLPYPIPFLIRNLLRWCSCLVLRFDWSSWCPQLLLHWISDYCHRTASQWYDIVCCDLPKSFWP